MANILHLPIVILDQMDPTDNVTVFMPENRSLSPVTRSWEREITPALKEGHKMVILHWVMHRRHFEPVMPINNHGTPQGRNEQKGQGDKGNMRALGKRNRQEKEPQRPIGKPTRLVDNNKGQESMDNYVIGERRRKKDPG